MNNTQTTQTSPKIYVACLAAYNNGILHGKWIEAAQDADDIHAEIQEMLTNSPIPGAEEWAIHDYEGFEGLSLSEYEDIETVAEMAKLIEEHGEAWAHYAAYVGTNYATREGFEEAYQGEWDSEEDFAYEIVSETMEIPEHIANYFDYEKFANDLFITDYYSAKSENYKVFVFRVI